MGKKDAKHAQNAEKEEHEHTPGSLWFYLERYIKHLQALQYHQHTWKEHKRYLKLFIEFSESYGAKMATEVTRDLVEDFQVYVSEYRKADGNKLNANGQIRWFVPVRVFFRWLTKRRYVLYNPASELEHPKIDRTLPSSILTSKEAERVMIQTDIHKSIGLRDRAILETFYSTGMRRFELTALCVSDIDFDRETVMIKKGKGRKARVIPIGDRALKWIEKYMKDARPKFEGENTGDLLFLSSKQRPLCNRRVSELVTHYLKKAKLKKTGSTHVFRHTMATLMLENGADVRFIQEMLGHSSLKATQIYTRVSIKKLKEVHTKTHPAKLKDYDISKLEVQDSE